MSAQNEPTQVPGELPRPRLLLQPPGPGLAGHFPAAGAARLLREHSHPGDLSRPRPR